MAQRYPRFRIRPTSRFKRNRLQVRPILGRGSRKHRQNASVLRCRRPTAVRMLGVLHQFQISGVFLCSFPGTSFCLSNFLSGSIPPKSTKRNRLARRLRENEFANRANKNGAEDELFFVGLFFNHHFWAFPDKLRKSRFFFPRARKGHES